MQKSSSWETHRVDRYGITGVYLRDEIGQEGLILSFFFFLGARAILVISDHRAAQLLHMSEVDERDQRIFSKNLSTVSRRSRALRFLLAMGRFAMPSNHFSFT